MNHRLLCWLLHVANTDPPWPRADFYGVKDRLLRRYGRPAGHQMQEIKKPCWGPWSDRQGERAGCPGKTCPHCGGTGVFDLRWVRLERWEWCGRVFHRPAGDTRIPPSPYPPPDMIRGLVQHRDYGRGAREAALWLYLITGEWRLLWSTLTSSAYCHCHWWPMLNIQRVAMKLRMRLSWRRCWCGRWFPTWGSGWQVCRKCRKPKATGEDIPF